MRGKALAKQFALDVRNWQRPLLSNDPLPERSNVTELFLGGELIKSRRRCSSPRSSQHHFSQRKSAALTADHHAAGSGARCSTVDFFESRATRRSSTRHALVGRAPAVKETASRRPTALL